MAVLVVVFLAPYLAPKVVSSGPVGGPLNKQLHFFFLVGSRLQSKQKSKQDVGVPG